MIIKYITYICRTCRIKSIILEIIRKLLFYCWIINMHCLPKKFQKSRRPVWYIIEHIHGIRLHSTIYYGRERTADAIESKKKNSGSAPTPTTATPCAGARRGSFHSSRLDRHRCHRQWTSSRTRAGVSWRGEFMEYLAVRRAVVFGVFTLFVRFVNPHT